MALEFQTTIETVDGIELPNAYGRVSVINGGKGDELMCNVDIYATKAAFEAGRASVFVKLIQGVRVAYDYATESHDTLDIAHDALIQKLGEQGVNAVKSL